MDGAIAAFFAKERELIPLFALFSNAMARAFPGCAVAVRKSQIAFQSGKTFCAVWLPVRAGIMNRPEHYFIVTFGLKKRIDSARIVSAVEPYPNRWTHHVLVSKPEDIDDALLGWLKEAYDLKHKTP